MFTIETWIKVTEDQQLKTAVVTITKTMVGVAYYNSVAEYGTGDAAELTTDGIDHLTDVHAKLHKADYTLFDTLTRS